MPDVLISSKQLVERLGQEEQQLKKLGLHGHAAGVRAAITAVIRLSEPEQAQDTGKQENT